MIHLRGTHGAWHKEPTWTAPTFVLQEPLPREREGATSTFGGYSNRYQKANTTTTKEKPKIIRAPTREDTNLASGTSCRLPVRASRKLNTFFKTNPAATRIEAVSTVTGAANATAVGAHPNQFPLPFRPKRRQQAVHICNRQAKRGLHDENSRAHRTSQLDS